MNYILALALAVLALLGLLKDWDAHKHPVRRFAVLSLIIVIALSTIANTLRNDRNNAKERTAAAQRDDANKKAIERLSNELTEANEKLEFQKGQLSAIAAMLKSNSADPTIAAALGVISRSTYGGQTADTDKQRQAEDHAELGRILTEGLNLQQECLAMSRRNTEAPTEFKRRFQQWDTKTFSFLSGHVAPALLPEYPFGNPEMTYPQGLGSKYGAFCEQLMGKTSGIQTILEKEYGSKP